MTNSENIYEKRFVYIKDKNLRKHMGDTFEFISKVIAISVEFPDNEKNYFYKTCILYTASLIEAHIHYLILELGYDKYEIKKQEFKTIKDLYETQSGEVIVIGNYKKQVRKLEGNVDFAILNKFAKENHIYNKDIFNEVDKVRELRNQIHLMKLSDIDRMYSKKTLNNCFDIAKKIFDIVKSKINNLQQKKHKLK